MSGMVATSGRYHAGTWRLAPCLVHLMHEVDERWPNRSRVSDGSIGDTSHAARKSDHNPDSTGDVLAVDITEDFARGPDLARFWSDVIARRDSRVKYLIYEGRIVASYPTAGLPAWTPRRYTGVNAHAHHLHVSVLDHARHDTSTWFPNVTPQQEDWFTMATEADLQRVVAAELRKVPRQAPGYFAVPSANSGVTYYVDASHQSKLRLERTGPLHHWIKALHQIANLGAEPVVVDQAVLDGIPDA